MHKKTSRRQLLRALAATAGGVGLSAVLGRTLLNGSEGESDQLANARQSHKAPMDIPTTATVAPLDEDQFVYVPMIQHDPTTRPTATSTPSTPTPPGGSRVVHVHAPDATFWDFGDNYYGNYVDQDVVNDMVDQGVMAITGATSVTQAWRMLVPNYVPGKAISIKVNFNNCQACHISSNITDALIHPINAIIYGLIQAYPNFEVSDVWVYDATLGNNPPSSARRIPARFTDSCLYPGVRFFDGACNETVSYVSHDPSGVIIWHNPPDIQTPPPARVTDVLVNAHYHINMPVMRKHVGGVTLSFKNHFGSIANCEPLHDWIFPSGAYYSSTYSPIVDIYLNPHIVGKTVLTVGDGLFGCWENNISKPAPWVTFGSDASNSIFFSTDPVAIDCVMCDLLQAETWMFRYAREYLVYANACGLGTYEQGDPWSTGYSQIDYHRVEL